MNTTSPTTLSSLLRRPEGAFLPLIRKADQIQALNDTLSAELDSTLRPHCRLVNLRGSVVVLAVESAAWATRLRFQSGELLSRLRAGAWPGIASIEVIILPQDKGLTEDCAPATKPSTERPPLNVRREIARLLHGEADHLPPEIGSRLRRLAVSYTKSV